jgi:hypothetical protein
MAKVFGFPFECSTALLLGYCQKVLEATVLLHTQQMQKVLQRDEVLAVLAVLAALTAL